MKRLEYFVRRKQTKIDFKKKILFNNYFPRSKHSAVLPGSLPFWALKFATTLLPVADSETLDFIKHFLICVLKMNEGLTGLE